MNRSSFNMEVLIHHLFLYSGGKYPGGLTCDDRFNHCIYFTAILYFCNHTDDWVKNRLRQLRNTFNRNKKPASSGSARKNVTKRTVWLMEKLQFLAPYVASRTTTATNLQPVSTLHLFMTFLAVSCLPAMAQSRLLN
jgi:hypothetical protein